MPMGKGIGIAWLFQRLLDSQHSPAPASVANREGWWELHFSKVRRARGVQASFGNNESTTSACIFCMFTSGHSSCVWEWERERYIYAFLPPILISSWRSKSWEGGVEGVRERSFVLALVETHEMAFGELCLWLLDLYSGEHESNAIYLSCIPFRIGCSYLI